MPNDGHILLVAMRRTRERSPKMNGGAAWNMAVDAARQLKRGILDFEDSGLSPSSSRKLTETEIGGHSCRTTQQYVNRDLGAEHVL